MAGDGTPKMVEVQAKPSGGSPAMTETDSTPRSATVVALDVAKSHNEVLIEPPYPVKCNPAQVVCVKFSKKDHKHPGAAEPLARAQRSAGGGIRQLAA
jgi:hypothetical protein